MYEFFFNFDRSHFQLFLISVIDQKKLFAPKIFNFDFFPPGSVKICQRCDRRENFVSIVFRSRHPRARNERTRRPRVDDVATLGVRPSERCLSWNTLEAKKLLHAHKLWLGTIEENLNVSKQAAAAAAVDQGVYTIKLFTSQWTSLWWNFLSVWILEVLDKRIFYVLCWLFEQR